MDREVETMRERMNEDSCDSVLPPLVDVIVERVVASQCDERAQAKAVGEEDLSRCIQPHL